MGALLLDQGRPQDRVALRRVQRARAARRRARARRGAVHARLGWGAIVQANIAADYWNHSIATRLNPAEAGSDILRDLGQIPALGTWLAPLMFVGLALVLSGIGHHCEGVAVAERTAVGGPG